MFVLSQYKSALSSPHSAPLPFPILFLFFIILSTASGSASHKKVADGPCLHCTLMALRDIVLRGSEGVALI